MRPQSIRNASPAPVARAGGCHPSAQTRGHAPRGAPRTAQIVGSDPVAVLTARTALAGAVRVPARSTVLHRDQKSRQVVRAQQSGSQRSLSWVKVQKELPIEKVWEEDHAGGRLQVLNIQVGGKDTWNAEHTLRVWTPPGYNQDEAKQAGNLPVLYMNDGQDMFHDGDAPGGCSWR
eukprot:CAMPEP_0118953476 /NCGR_PEP_ID=MMETSP1169-20130426/56639_1 /TAXON_ID=36882 /ORGANISM="Pyramimonas obovata, Strain CCMP722" /LENGTH=175 /DNA_ID=CAMNT_0006900943 /DNA_START=203 /DNA_END=727 /DNA_ORIENTATION=-